MNLSYLHDRLFDTPRAQPVRNVWPKKCNSYGGMIFDDVEDNFDDFEDFEDDFEDDFEHDFDDLEVERAFQVRSLRK